MQPVGHPGRPHQVAHLVGYLQDALGKVSGVFPGAPLHRQQDPFPQARERRGFVRILSSVPEEQHHRARCIREGGWSTPRDKPARQRAAEIVLDPLRIASALP